MIGKLSGGLHGAAWAGPSFTDAFLTSRSADNPLPSKEDLLAFIGEQGGKAGTREIARAFGLKNADRAALKAMLRDLADQGAIEKRRKKLHHSGVLPSVVLAEITGRDIDGELVAVPAEWDEAHGAAPKIRLHVPRRARPGDVPGVGDRALLRTERTSEDDDAIAYVGRVIKLIDRAKHRVLGVFRKLAGGGGRLAPIDKKQLGRELAIPPGATHDAEEGDLVAVEVSRGRGFRLGLPSARVIERLGSLATEKAVSLIAIHAHGIPHEFSRAALREAEAARPAGLAGREDWRDVPFVTIDPADAKDHDDAVIRAPRQRSKEFRRLHHRCRDRRRRPLRDAGRRARPRGAAARQFGLFPGPGGADAARAHLERPVLAAPRRRPGGDGGADDDRRRRPQARAPLPPRADPLDRPAHYAQVQAAIDGQPDAATEPLLPLVIGPLYAAHAALKRAREDRGPLDLDLPERKILLRPDNTIDRVISPERLDAHRMIEEFMILANVAAAETLERARVPSHLSGP